MAEAVLKLYRGLSSSEFTLTTDELLKRNKTTWALILKERAKGGLAYPAHLDTAIKALHKDSRLEFQYFTDAKAVAEAYARKVNGLLVELPVPVKDVLSHFDIEFQNFGRRKKQFEIVYRVKGSTLAKNGKKWKMRVKRKK